MIYLFDPINNMKTPTNYDLLEGMTGYSKSTLMSYKSKRKKLMNINCYLIDDKFTKKELLDLRNLEHPKNEIWKIAPGTDGMYEVSNYGRMRNTETHRLINPSLNGQGCLSTNLYINGKKVFLRIHRLVAEAFLKQPKGCNFVIHIGSKYNNHADNLRWVNKQYVQKWNGRCNKISKSVYKLDPETYEVLDEYDSIRQAARENWVDKKNMSRASHDIKKTCAGFRWCLVDEYSNLKEMTE